MEKIIAFIFVQKKSKLMSIDSVKAAEAWWLGDNNYLCLRGGGLVYRPTRAFTNTITFILDMFYMFKLCLWKLRTNGPCQNHRQISCCRHESGLMVDLFIHRVDFLRKTSG